MDLVTRNGGVRVAEVVEALGISEMTVRRDITELVSAGLVERVHGGAVAAGPTTIEPRLSSIPTKNARLRWPPLNLCAPRILWRYREAPPLWQWRAR